MPRAQGSMTPSSLSVRVLASVSCLVLTAALATPKPSLAASTTAARAGDFLNSLGANSAISKRGESLAKTQECVRYLGLRWLRAGIEGDVPTQDFLDLHTQTGVRFSWGLGSGGTDIAKLIQTAKPVAAAGALLAFEGPNEPNNWGVTYQGQAGGRNGSWLPVAHLQNDLYKAVKGDPELAKYPVWSITENGAETDNVGMQFLTIPAGAKTSMPDGTRYADAANVHNYIYHPNAPGLADNKTWDAADPSPACKVDGLYGEYGSTWAHHYPGVPVADLPALPKVTTETGCAIDGPVTEDIHALNLLSLYLDQFKRGWTNTAVYLLRDRVDEGGNQRFGFYRPDYTPRKAAVYLHNLTTILADKGTLARLGRLDYTIPNEPTTVHDLLLQKSDGTFDLVVWGERLQGSDSVTVRLDKPQAGMRVYDPTLGTTPTQTPGKTASLTLTLSDHPLIIAIPAKARR